MKIIQCMTSLTQLSQLIYMFDWKFVFLRLKLCWTSWTTQTAAVPRCPMKTWKNCSKMLRPWCGRWRTGTSPLRRRLLRKKETRPRNVRYFSKFLQNLIIPDVDWRKSYWSITFPFTYSVLFYLPVLDYIKANVSKQCDQNEAAAKKIRGLLEGFEDKLKDLDEALKNATNMVKKANSQNGLNAQALESLQVLTLK